MNFWLLWKILTDPIFFVVGHEQKVVGGQFTMSNSPVVLNYFDDKDSAENCAKQCNAQIMVGYRVRSK